MLACKYADVLCQGIIKACVGDSPRDNRLFGHCEDNPG